MKVASLVAALAVQALPSLAGTILWDGRFNDFTSSADLNDWSWSNEVGPYQYYIHGPGNVTEYINLSPSYKNPADAGSAQGARFTLDATAYWEGQTMRRTELIPQTSAAINAGKVWYHFSMMALDDGTFPSLYREHQICFFESHFTEMKAGWISGEAGTSDANLRWDVGSVTQWSTNFTGGVWHNIAYEIDFSAGTVGFWHSTGGDDLVEVVSPISASTSSNGADWHLGVLELPRDGYADADENLYFSGVYIESGDITTSVSGPGEVEMIPRGVEQHTYKIDRIHWKQLVLIVDAVEHHHGPGVQLDYSRDVHRIDHVQDFEYQHEQLCGSDFHLHRLSIQPVWWPGMDGLHGLCFGEYLQVFQRLLLAMSLIIPRGA